MRRPTLPPLVETFSPGSPPLLLSLFCRREPQTGDVMSIRHVFGPRFGGWKSRGWRLHLWGSGCVPAQWETSQGEGMRECRGGPLPAPESTHLPDAGPDLSTKAGPATSGDPAGQGCQDDTRFQHVGDVQLQ